MPRTTIIRHTYHCTDCGYESDRLVGSCSTPECKGEIYQETDPSRCGSMTVIGSEDIENEIANIQAARANKQQAPLPDDQIVNYRTQRTNEKDAAIAAINLRVHDPIKAASFNTIVTRPVSRPAIIQPVIN